MRLLTPVLTCITAASLLALAPLTAQASDSDPIPHGVQYQQTKAGLDVWVDGRKQVLVDQRAQVRCEWSDPETDHTVADDVLDRGAGVAFPWTPIRRDLDVWTSHRLPVVREGAGLVARHLDAGPACA